MEARRPLTIRADADFNANQETVRGKFIKNWAEGKQAFRAGEVKPFGGFSRTAFEHEFQARVELTDSTRTEIAERVTLPLQEVGQKTGIKLIAAGFDFDSSHIILGTGKFSKDADPADVDAQVQMLISDGRFSMIRNAMRGRMVTLDGLVNSSNGSVYVCSRDVSEEMFRARTTITNLLGRKINLSETGYSSEKTVNALPSDGFSLVDFKDITHSTVARLGAKATPEQLYSFHRQTGHIAEGLRDNPIQAEIADVYFGTSINVMNKIAPHLITQP